MILRLKWQKTSRIRRNCRARVVSLCYLIGCDSVDTIVQLCTVVCCYDVVAVVAVGLLLLCAVPMPRTQPWESQVTPLALGTALAGGSLTDMIYALSRQPRHNLRRPLDGEERPRPLRATHKRPHPLRATRKRPHPPRALSVACLHQPPVALSHLPQDLELLLLLQRVAMRCVRAGFVDVTSPTLASSPTHHQQLLHQPKLVWHGTCCGTFTSHFLPCACSPT